MRRSEALRKAFEDEDQACAFLEQHTFSGGIEISNYDGVCTPKHIQQREVVFREFAKQNFFYDEVMNIVGSLVISRGRTRDVAREESLALYVLHELPFFIDGVQKMDNSRQYT